MEISSQRIRIRINDVWRCISLCTHNDMIDPSPRCSMLACIRCSRFCGICVVRTPSRSVPLCHTNIECEGEGASFTGGVACQYARINFANFFPSTVPFNMVMHCSVACMRDRYVCPYNTGPGSREPSPYTWSCSAMWFEPAIGMCAHATQDHGKLIPSLAGNVPEPSRAIPQDVPTSFSSRCIIIMT